ncbi:MAG: TIGR02099 family protein [Burkholderiales bacterium]|nr:TIGR02099 family protein [Burkholderiales bacterium]
MDSSRLSSPPGVAFHIRRVIVRTLRTIEWLLWAVFFIVALTFIALRYAILPHIEQYRPQVEAALSQALKQKVTIGRMEAGWDGLRPDLDLFDVRLYDRQGRPALALPFLSVTPSWWSIPARELRLHQLEIVGADLDVRRTRGGRIVIAGFELAAERDDSENSDWILAQRRIVVTESRLRWNDEARAAPELALNNIRAVIENDGNRHRFGFAADPPRELASRLDLRADLTGVSLNLLKDWSGSLYADLKYIDLAAWRAWLDYPADVRSGQGSLRAWLGFVGSHLEFFTADIGLDRAQARLGPDLPVLALTRVSGRIGARELSTGGKALGFLRIGSKEVTGFEVRARQIALTTEDGMVLKPADFVVKTQGARANRPQEIEVEANSLDLEPLATLIEHLPVDAAARRALAEFNPRGEVFDLNATWRGDFDAPQGFTARARFSDLALAARGLVPGFAGLSGTVEATEKGGSMLLASRGTALDLPRVFEDPRLNLDVLSANLRWAYPNGRLEVRADAVQFANEDASGSAQALYRVVPDTPGYLELTAKLARANGARVHRYLPRDLEDTRRWLVAAIEKARVDEATFAVKGNIHDFPFADAKKGNFRVLVRISDGALKYAPDWPGVESVKGELIFERQRMEFRGNTPGTVGGTRLGRLEVKIADLGARPAVLTMNGGAEGPTQAFLEFINDSPVHGMIDKFTETMRAGGTGRLTLQLTLPIKEVQKTRVTGQYTFVNNDIRLDDDLPQLARVNGVLAFSETGFSLRQVRGDALGGQFSVAGGSRGDATTTLNASGNFTIPGVRTWIDDPIFASLSGGSTWRATINVRRRGGDVTVESNLAGVAIDLPAPLGKAAAAETPLRVVRTPVAGSTRGEDEFNVTLGRSLSARMQRRPEGEDMRFSRGAIGIGEAAPALPRGGLVVAMAAPVVDFELWKARVIDARGGAATPGAGGAGYSAYQPFLATLKADAFDVYGKRLNQVQVALSQEGATWVAGVVSREVNGALTFRPGEGRDPGRLGVRLRNLVVPAGVARGDGRTDTPLDRIVDDLPAVDAQIDAFEVADKKLGALELLAINAGGEWRIQRLNLANPDGVLAGSGAWRARRQGEARRKLGLDFTLEAYDAGKLLDRLGFPGTLRAGSGRLEGNLTWDGSPLAVDYPSLAGTMNVRVEKGQFLKADPGVGKLLGIMSLQALPRRLTLDFRDVFSEGFAFDRVSASSHVNRGILSTTDFKMEGVSAAVLMNGEVDLVRETQNLRAVVLPDLSGGMGSVVTALLGNPILGLATYLAQRALKNPLSRAFSFEYAVTGTWADPRVARVESPLANAPDPALGPQEPPARPPAEVAPGGTGELQPGRAAGDGARTAREEPKR